VGLHRNKVNVEVMCWFFIVGIISWVTNSNWYNGHCQCASYHFSLRHNLGILSKVKLHVFHLYIRNTHSHHWQPWQCSVKQHGKYYNSLRESVQLLHKYEFCTLLGHKNVSCASLWRAMASAWQFFWYTMFRKLPLHDIDLYIFCFESWLRFE